MILRCPSSLSRWATGGIGLAVGAGMYWEAAIATILALAGLEILTVIFRGLGVKALNAYSY